MKVTLEQLGGWGVPILAINKPHTNYSWPSAYMDPPYPLAPHSWLPILRSNQLQSCSTVVFAIENKETHYGDFPGGSVVKNLPASAGDMELGPDLGKSHMPQSSNAHVPQPSSRSSRA